MVLNTQIVIVFYKLARSAVDDPRVTDRMALQNESVTSSIVDRLLLEAKLS
jgi:hypothetical protein